MDYRNRVRDIFSYLLSVKNINEKAVKNISEYDKVYWENDLIGINGCNINRDYEKDWWMQVTKKCKPLYDDFFKLYLQLEKMSGKMEMIWGHGLIVWKLDNKELMHPIFLTKMKLNFDADNGIFTLTPSSKTSIDLSIFDGFKDVDISAILSIEDNLKSKSIDPRFMGNLQDMFAEIISIINLNGKIEVQALKRDKIEICDNPIIYNSPVVFVRKNNLRLWQQEIKNIIERINNGCFIPNTIKSLVEDRGINVSKVEKDEWSEVGEKLLLPLPANSQQKEIVKRLCDNYGVVVQGPPGTGKSHTIVNLICHLLAHGKRVLVTSQTGKALRVLAEKIPEEIRPLCISVLGDDNDSMKDLDESVRKITDNLSIEQDSLLREIRDLELQLDECIKRQEFMLDKFKKIEKIENDDINYDGESYKIIDIAKWVRENKKYAWIDDKIGIREKMCLTGKEFKNLTLLINSIDNKDRQTIGNLNAIIYRLPKKEEVYEKIVKFKSLSSDYENLKEKIEGWNVSQFSRCNYDKLISTLYQCREKLESIEDSTLAKVLKDYYKSNIVHDTFVDLSHKCNEYLRLITKVRNDLRSHRIEIPVTKSLDEFAEDFVILYEHLNNRGKVTKVFKVMHPECAYILRDCKVDGRPIENIDDAVIIKLFIQEGTLLNKLKVIWNNTVKEYGGRIINENSSITEIVLLENYIDKINTIVRWDETKKTEIINLLGKVSLPENIDWHKSETYVYIIDCIKTIKELEEFNDLKAYIEVVKKLILTTGKFKDLYLALQELDEDKICVGLTEIDRLKFVKNNLDKVNSVLDKMRQSCPNTAKNIEKNWAGYLESCNNWELSWKWSQWNKLMEDIYSLDIDVLESNIQEEKNREKYLIKEIVAKKTWYNQMKRTTEVEKRSLFAWMQAVKRIGKGRGKLVSEYRQTAQQEMEKCKEVIPVWIMPLNRVIENINLTNKPFDVIIFDESSQSDIFAICALMRAKRAVIVGDDKQISPETIGVDQSAIYDLIKSYLKNIPQNEWFDLQTSLYDTALRVFPNRLMLKEHFRCIPEIIGFSNDLCYFGEIEPLRYAKNEERFANPIVPIKVMDGFRESGKAVNVPEAESLVNKLVECCKDRKYSGMTMGVISLLGDAQGEVIESMIREKLGEEEMIRRRIVCGDAYSFQGDERDVMFLSMVIGNNIKFNSLTKPSDIRRFNVAASRARNQMWLFYSVDLNDLSMECARYSLLNYCINYEKYQNKLSNVNYMFQSPFQKDVYNMMLEKGYEVTPGVKIDKYRVDFVIDGEGTRAAIICDGDNCSANSNWEESLDMQLNLERLGWTICRIRGGEFYYNTEKTIKKLTDKLRKFGIEEYKKGSPIEEKRKVV